MDMNADEIDKSMQRHQVKRHRRYRTLEHPLQLPLQLCGAVRRPSKVPENLHCSVSNQGTCQTLAGTCLEGMPRAATYLVHSSVG